MSVGARLGTAPEGRTTGVRPDDAGRIRPLSRTARGGVRIATSMPTPSLTTTARTPTRSSRSSTRAARVSTRQLACDRSSSEAERPAVGRRPKWVGSSTPSSAGSVRPRNIEVTLEANPGTVVQDRFERFVDAGINRFSIGVQSLNDRELVDLGRIHDARAATDAVATACRTGARVSLDLMYGFAGQRWFDVKDTLDRALDLGTDHVSAYTPSPSNPTPCSAARPSPRTVRSDARRRSGGPDGAGPRAHLETAGLAAVRGVELRATRIAESRAQLPLLGRRGLPRARAPAPTRIFRTER